MASVWIYILRCADGSYYTGHSSNLEKRLAKHQSGEICGWTRSRRPVELVFQQEMTGHNEAFLAERRIKKWSRAKKTALIEGQWDALRRLAKKRNFRG